jgi:hypothetical protein
VQISPVLYSREGTVDKVVRQIHERMAWGQGDGSGLCAVDSADLEDVVGRSIGPSQLNVCEGFSK